MSVVDKPAPMDWALPYSVTPYFFKKRQAKNMLNKYAYVGLSYVNKNGKVYKRESFHGSIVVVDQKAGVQIWENGTGKIKNLPPDLRAWKQVTKGTYKDVKTGEIVSGVEYMSVWLVMQSHLLSPEIMNEQLTRRNGGTYNIYGFGTRMYGKANKKDDGSFTTTKWLTAFLFPIWPLATYRISGKKRSISFGFGLSGSHQASPLFLDTRQVTFTYLISLPLLVLFILIIINILGK